MSNGGWGKMVSWGAGGGLYCWDESAGAQWFRVADAIIVSRIFRPRYNHFFWGGGGEVLNEKRGT